MKQESCKIIKIYQKSLSLFTCGWSDDESPNLDAGRNRLGATKMIWEKNIFQPELIFGLLISSAFNRGSRPPLTPANDLPHIKSNNGALKRQSNCICASVSQGTRYLSLSAMSTSLITRLPSCLASGSATSSSSSVKKWRGVMGCNKL